MNFEGTGWVAEPLRQLTHSMTLQATYASVGLRAKVHTDNFIE
jgi:hypothetical protein